MYSVFIVEDEIVIREGVKQLVAWEEYGFTFIGGAPDGEMAWPIIQKQKPDIVITDIKMPFMDGLALSRLIKKELPGTIVIILSGHDDFSYAQEAIAIGVNQYLLKPLSKDQLVEVLLEVKKKKDEDFAQTQYNIQFANEVREYLSSSMRGFFDALVSGNLSVPNLLERSHKLGLDLTAERYNIVLFLLGEDILQDDYSSSIEEVQYEISHTFSDTDHFVVFGAGMGVTAFLVKANEGDILQYTQECIDTLNRICQPMENSIHWVVVAGQPVFRLSAIAECYKETRKALFNMEAGAYKFAKGLPDSVSIDFNPNEMDANKLDPRLIEKFLSNGLHKDIESFAEDYFDGFGLESVKSFIFRYYVVLNIQFAVNAFMEKIGTDKSKNYNPESKKQELEEALSSIDGSKKYVVQLLSEAMLLRDNAALSRYKGMLSNVVSHMKENFSNPELNLNTVAQIANVTPTHFSAVFSQQMGKTFVEYLTELRIEKAKELLCCTSDGSSEIALKVGYNDPHYFSFLFKKINGCSPRDYRNGRR